MKYLIALDLEGVGGVVGVPYSGLAKESDAWYQARSQAILEVNTVAKALFDTGAELVALWDNHGGGSNLDYSLLDERIELIIPDRSKIRQAFGKDYGFDAMYFLGYHAMDGTVGAVLAHTFNSSEIQYFKINGKPVGEIWIDKCYAGQNGYAPVFFAGDDKACLEASLAIPGIITVETKKGISRNKALFKDNTVLLDEIYEKAKLAANLRLATEKFSFPFAFEVRYTRMETAEKALEEARADGVVCFYQSDAHTVLFVIENIEQFDSIRC